MLLLLVVVSFLLVQLLNGGALPVQAKIPPTSSFLKTLLMCRGVSVACYKNDIQFAMPRPMFGTSLRARWLLFLAALALVCLADHADANNIGVCIRNCAQCKKMFGPYFEGQLCADACVKFKGKIIPDCEDVASIAPFLNKFE